MKKKWLILILLILCFLLLLIKFTVNKSSSLPVQGITLVTGFPDLPVYPKAQLVSSSKIVDLTVAELGYRLQVVWQSHDPVPQISKWYRENYPKSGWPVTVPPAQDSQLIQLVYFSQGESTIYLSLIPMKDSQGSEIIVDYIPKRIIEVGEEEENE